MPMMIPVEGLVDDTVMDEAALRKSSSRRNTSK